MLYCAVPDERVDEEEEEEGEGAAGCGFGYVMVRAGRVFVCTCRFGRERRRGKVKREEIFFICLCD